MTTVAFSLASGSFSQNWSDLGLITTADDWSGVPSIVGYLGDDASTATAPVDPATSQILGAVDVIANQTNTTITNGGVAEFQLADPTVALQGSGTADAPSLVLYLDASGRENVNVSYLLRDIDGSADNAVQSVALQYSVDGGSSWTNVPSAFVADATGGPNAATLTTAVSATLGSDANDVADLQVRIVTGNAVGSDEWVGVDDILVTSDPATTTGPTLSVSSASVVEGDSGTTNLEFTVTLSEAPSGTVTVDYATADGTAAAGSDYTAAAGTLTFNAGDPLTRTVTVAVGGDAAVEPNETLALTLSNATNATVATGTGTGTIRNDDVEITLISAIQGAAADQTANPVGDSDNEDGSPLRNQVVTIEAIVTADFQAGMGGFYVQEEDADADADEGTSEGIFVASAATDVAVGDKVQITGTVSEFFGETQLRSVTGVSVLSGDEDLPTAAVVDLPSAGTSTAQFGRAQADLEQYEGMRVAFADTLTITEQFQLDRYNEVGLFAAEGFEQTGSDGETVTGLRPFQYSQFNDPSVAGNAAYLEEIAARTIFYDDGSNAQNRPVQELDGFEAYATQGAPGAPSMGDTIDDLTGVLSYSRNGEGSSVGSTWRVRATGDDDNAVDDTQPEPPADVTVNGDLRIASLNVLNYFTTLDDGTNETEIGLDPRGANTAFELGRQETKLVNAIVGLDADVLGLIELENDFLGDNGQVAIDRLVDLVNARLGGTVYDWVRPGQEFVGTDAIAVGMMYKVGTVRLADGTGTATLDDADVRQDLIDQSNFNAVFNGPNTSRSPLAATFEALAGGEAFTVVVNHLKSKGDSSGDATGSDLDGGDGAGNYNNQRELAVKATLEWLAGNPTGSTSPDNTFLVGDFNAYAQENPIDLLKAAGFEDIVNTLIEEAYSYVFDGLLGTLDYAFASMAIFDEIVDALEWHINSDQADALDFNTDFGRSPDYFDGDTPLRGSDHDPVLVGFALPDDGTEGADAVAGDAADNRFLFVEGSLTDGDVIDGADGTDTVELSGGGTFSFAGVTLTDIEAIAATDVDASTIVFDSARQARLLAAADGAADTAVLAGAGVRPDLFLALFGRGVETINLPGADLSGTARATVAGGEIVGFAATFTDTSAGDAYRFLTRTEVYDARGKLTEQTLLLDDGTTVATEFRRDGSVVSLEKVRPDGSSLVRTFDADGTITGLVKERADGLVATTSFTDGERTAVVLSDPEDVRPYETRTTEYDGDERTTVTTAFDAGEAIVGRVVSFADGTVESRVVTFADGTLERVDFAGGARVLKTVENVDGSVVKTDFDAGDNALFGTQFDDALIGGGGNDSLVGREGDDSLTGGSGTDTFVYEAGSDVVRDFRRADLLDFTAFGIEGPDDAGITITQDAAGTTVAIAGEDDERIVLEGYTRSLTGDDFVKLMA